MAEHHSHESAGPTEEQLKASVAAGYEINDVSIPVLIKWLIGMGVFLGATSVAMLLLFIVLQHKPFGPQPVESSFVGGPAPVPATGTPILQDNPAGDPRPDNNPRKGVDNIREFRRDEEIRINEYAKQDGDIHIPLERAMELTLKDFPAQKPGEPPTGVPPTPEMKLHPPKGSTSPDGAEGTAPAPPVQR